MKKVNRLVKLSSWIFILTGIIELAGIALLIREGGTRLSNFFDMLFVNSEWEIVLFITVIIIRVMIGSFGLLKIQVDICICLAIFLVIKDFALMYYFYNTNIYMFLYRSISELFLVVPYLLGALHYKYAEIR